MIRLAFLLLLSSAPLLADAPKLVVRGEARIYKPSDLVTLTLGVVTEEPTAALAIDTNRRRMESVRQAINRFKIDPQSIQTTTFNLEPLHTSRPNNAPTDWTPTLYAYRATNLLTIRTEKLADLGALIDAATVAGATAFESLQFTLKDKRAAKMQAIAEATQNAMQAANTLAKTAEIKLGDLRTVTLDPLSEPVAYQASFAKFGATSIASGDVEISASVSLEYDICSYCQ